MVDQPRRSLISHLFFYLYLVVKLFIVVGEIVKRTLLIPFYIGRFIIFSISSFAKLLYRSLRNGIQLIKKSISQLLKILNQGSKKLTNGIFIFLKKPFSFTIRIPTFHFKTKEKSTHTIPEKKVFHKKNIPIPKKKHAHLSFHIPVFPFGKIIRYIFHLVVNNIISLLRSVFAIFTFLCKTILNIVNSILLFPFRLLHGLFTLQLRFFLVGFFTCLIFVACFQTYTFALNLPSPRNIGKTNYPVSTLIYDRNGIILYEIYHDQNRTPVQLKNIPTYVYQASIAIEDKDFFNHDGIALFSGVLRALKDMALNKGLQGGSTITQQLVKSALLSPERTIDRKLKEMILAIWTEKLFTKNQILEMYLNQVPYGGSAYGIEEAGKLYFGKSASELTMAEAALLAGLPQAPSVYSPFINRDAAIERRNEVLDKMYEQGFITNQQKEDAKNSQLFLVPFQTGIKAPHFVFYVKDSLQEQFGMQQVEEGGLRVSTTLDMQVQKQTEQILTEELEKVKYLNITNGAVLVTRPSTGEILAMVGSENYFAQPSGSYNDTLALRQPGSSVKPFTYALALEKGYTAATIIDDSPITFTYPGSPSYRPVNYDGKFHGSVPLRIALANSFNVPAVKTLNKIGVPEYLQYTSRLGITTWTNTDRYGLSLTLGGAEVRMVDMSTAFGVFANQGYRVDLTPFQKIESMYGSTVDELSPQKTRVMPEGVSFIISDILSDNFARQWEFGQHSALEIPGYKVAVKTGTTDNKKDNWTIGYTPEFLVAVWVGNNDNKPMNQALASGISGAAPIWNRVMSYILANYSTHNTWFSKPNTIVEKPCFYGKTEYFIQGTESKVPCSLPTATPKPTSK